MLLSVYTVVYNNNMINKKSTLSVGQNPGVHCLTNNLTVGTKTQPVSVTVGADMQSAVASAPDQTRDRLGFCAAETQLMFWHSV